MTSLALEQALDITGQALDTAGLLMTFLLAAWMHLTSPTTKRGSLGG
jgi:hypothetical protein